MKMTLLEIVVDVMNSMDGEVVTSISDTIESQQVALIIKNCYAEFLAHRNWPHMRKAFTLSATASTTATPTQFILPEEIKELEWFKYNKRRQSDTRDKFLPVNYLAPEDFYEHCAARASSATNIQVVSLGEVNLNIRKDIPPEYWTSFDEVHIVCDAYDQSVSSILLTSRTACFGVRNPTWVHTDGAYPELPNEAFPAFLEECKSTCFYELRQTANEKSEQKAVRQGRWLSRKAWRAKGGVKYPDYGRKRGARTAVRQHNPQFSKDP